MKCPIDETVLVISQRSGIEIDYCPTCRGVWLDRGELDKLISVGENTSTHNHTTNNSVMRNNNDEDDHMSGGRHQNGRPQQRESFLSNLFDF